MTRAQTDLEEAVGCRHASHASGKQTNGRGGFELIALSARRPSSRFATDGGRGLEVNTVPRLGGF